MFARLRCKLFGHDWMWVSKAESKKMCCRCGKRWCGKDINNWDAFDTTHNYWKRITTKASDEEEE